MAYDDLPDTGLVRIVRDNIGRCLYSDQTSIWQIIISQSAQADLVILGMGLPEKGKEREFMARMDDLIQRLPTTLLVKSMEEIRLI